MLLLRPERTRRGHRFWSVMNESCDLTRVKVRKPAASGAGLQALWISPRHMSRPRIPRPDLSDRGERRKGGVQMRCKGHKAQSRLCLASTSYLLVIDDRFACGYGLIGACKNPVFAALGFIHVVSIV